MNLWKIAWRSIQQRSLASALTGISMALGVMLVVSVLVTYDAVDNTFQKSGLGYNLLVGGKGGRLDLLLNSVYYLSRSIEPVPYSYYKELKQGKFGPVDLAVPVCLGDYFGDFRVVGTTPDMFNELTYGAKDSKYRFASGRNFKQDGYFEAVVGNVVAKKMKVRVGDTFQPTHSAPESADGHVHEEKFTIVGILEQTGTPNDRAAFINIEGFYLLPKHAKDPPAGESADAEASADGEAAHEHGADEEHEHAHDAEHAHEHDAEEEHEHAHDHEHDADEEHEHAHDHDAEEEHEHEADHKHADDDSEGDNAKKDEVKKDEANKEDKPKDDAGQDPDAEHAAEHDHGSNDVADGADKDADHDASHEHEAADDTSRAGGAGSTKAEQPKVEVEAAHSEDAEHEAQDHADLEHDGEAHEEDDHEGHTHADGQHEHEDEDADAHKHEHADGHKHGDEDGDAHKHGDDKAHSGHDHGAHDHAGHDHAGHDHHHAPLPENQREVTAMLVRMEPLASMSFFQKINEGRDAQAVLPVLEMTGLFNVFVRPLQIVLLSLTVLIVIVAGIGILVSIYNSMSSRQHEIAVMRALGAGRGTVMLIVLAESILLSLGGGLLGWFLGHLLLVALNPWIVTNTGVSVGFFQFDVFELVIIPGLILLAALVGYLPALAAYRTDVAKALSANP